MSSKEQKRNNPKKEPGPQIQKLMEMPVTARLVLGECKLEIEEILKQILKNNGDNIEVIASLSEIYSHRGENADAMELIDTALEQDPTSLIVKLIKMKLQAKKERNSNEFIRSLDDIIHFLVTDERFQIYKDTATDPDIIWLYETSDEKETLKL